MAATIPVMEVCDPANVVEGVCSSPYWMAVPQSPFPVLTLEDGMVISFAIVGLWTTGLIARLMIRAAQAGEKP